MSHNYARLASKTGSLKQHSQTVWCHKCGTITAISPGAATAVILTEHCVTSIRRSPPSTGRRDALSCGSTFLATPILHRAALGMRYVICTDIYSWIKSSSIGEGGKCSISHFALLKVKIKWNIQPLICCFNIHRIELYIREHIFMRSRPEATD